MIQITNAKTGTETNYMYVTANQTQSIAQASVKYLVELTSQSSLQSLYFIAIFDSVTDRSLKLKFYVFPLGGSPTAADGETMFGVGSKDDSYPMGFYAYKIYEQTSTSNLDPANASLLEEGTAYVTSKDGQNTELPDPFTEFTDTPTQYVYQS